jgi:uncharacterized protein (TIGR02300 family)
MPAKDMGTKWTCFKCGTKFYDLKKPDPLCPKCGANPQDSPTLKATPAEKKRAAAREVVEEPVVAAVPDEAPDDDAEVEDEVPPPEEDVAEEEDLDA